MIRAFRRLAAVAAITCAGLAAAGCNPVYYVGLKLVYRHAALPERQTIHNVPYDTVVAGPKHQLDLFLPAARDFPTVVFIHGGNWTEGDRGLRVGGADVYGNIGRFLAQHGTGAAVISYRLIPDVDWRGQAEDVVKAVAWVHHTIGQFGGRPDAIFLMGHSAGAQLAVRTALDRAALARADVPASAIAGIIAVSGAGYDLTDAETYALGNDPAFYAKRFQLGLADTDWQREASPIQFVGPDAPPSLLMYAAGETKPLQRQSQVLHEALVKAGATTKIIAVPGLSHTRIVPTLSRADRVAGAAILEFIELAKARLARQR